MGKVSALKRRAGFLRRRMADAGRPRRLLPAGRALRHVGHDLHPHLRAGAGRARCFLINPYGMLFGEITASCFLKVKLDGTVSTAGHGYGLHLAGFVIHSGIYLARPDVKAVMHTHTIAGMAVSSLKCGLLPLTQTATRFYTRIAYHDFTGPERDPSERKNSPSTSATTTS